jgi:hypothetical protein
MQPEQVYPVYGDASLRSFDARSGRPPVPAAGQRQELRCCTATSSPATASAQPLGQGAVASLKQRSLGAYNRTATGAARCTTRRRRWPATSSPSAIRCARWWRNLPARARAPTACATTACWKAARRSRWSCATGCSPSRIVAVQAAGAAGGLRLRALLGPHPADADSCRSGRRRPQPDVSLRVTYEVDQGGRRASGSAGADVQARWARAVEVGGSVVERPQPAGPIPAAQRQRDLAARPRAARVVVEAAGSARGRQARQHPQRHRPARPHGRRQRPGLARRSWRMKVMGHEAACLRRPQRPRAFDNPAAPLNGGRGEAQASGRLELMRQPGPDRARPSAAKTATRVVAMPRGADARPALEAGRALDRGSRAAQPARDRGHAGQRPVVAALRLVRGPERQPGQRQRRRCAGLRQPGTGPGHGPAADRIRWPAGSAEPAARRHAAGVRQRAPGPGLAGR